MFECLKRPQIGALTKRVKNWMLIRKNEYMVELAIQHDMNQKEWAGVKVEIPEKHRENGISLLKSNRSPILFQGIELRQILGD